MKKLIILALALFQNYCYSQKVEFSINFAPNYSKPSIATIEEKKDPLPMPNSGYYIIESPSPEVKFITTGKVGFDLGSKLNFFFSNRWSIATGLDLNLYNFDYVGKTREIEDLDVVFYNTPSSQNNSTHLLTSGRKENVLLYLAIPVNLEFKLNKFILISGLNMSHLVYSVHKYEQLSYHISTTGYTPQVSYARDDTGQQYQKFSLRGTIGVEYKLSPRFSIQAKYLRGLTNTFDNQKEGKMNTFSAGVSINLGAIAFQPQ